MAASLPLSPALRPHLLRPSPLPTVDAVRSLVVEREPEVPAMEPLAVDLESYDELLVAEVGR